jgi:hypothetical protein
LWNFFYAFTSIFAIKMQEYLINVLFLRPKFCEKTKNEEESEKVGLVVDDSNRPSCYLNGTG